VTSALSGGLATVVLSVVIGLALPRFASYRRVQAAVDSVQDEAGCGTGEFAT
jgi:hypothetical protein